MPIVVALLGAPRGQGRPRFVKATGHAHKDAKTQRYEDNLGTVATRVMAGRKPLDEALTVYILAVFPVPRSWSRKKQAAALVGQIRPTSRPDADNLVKAALDSLNKIVWRDDALAVDVRCVKKYGEKPRLVVVVSPISGEKSNA